MPRKLRGRLLHRRLGCAHKRIDFELQRDAAWQGGLLGRTQRGHLGGVGLQGLVVGLHAERETYIALGVFVRAAHLGVAGQRGKLGQGAVHVLGAALIGD